MQKKLKLLCIFIFLVLCFGEIYGFWHKICPIANGETNVLFKVGEFDLNVRQTPCDLATVFIDEEFFNKYMNLNQQGEYDWIRDCNTNVVNFEEIKSLSSLGTIIKREICFIVIAPTYNFVFHGLPEKQNTNHLDWALMPVGLNYVENWAYRLNRVVKTADGQYFMARNYVENNPLVDRMGWNKIEPTKKEDFYCYEGTNVPNYSTPILQNIVRSYQYDAHTKYLIGDVVTLLGSEYVAIRNCIGATPNAEKWAWTKL